VCVDVEADTATYTVTAGDPVDLAHHGDPFTPLKCSRSGGQISTCFRSVRRREISSHKQRVASGFSGLTNERAGMERERAGNASK